MFLFADNRHAVCKDIGRGCQAAVRGRSLACASFSEMFFVQKDHSIAVLDVASDSLLQLTRFHALPPVRVLSWPNAKSLVSCCPQYIVTWDLCSLRPACSVFSKERMSDAAVLPSVGKIAVCYASTPAISLLNANDLSLHATIRCPDERLFPRDTCSVCVFAPGEASRLICAGPSGLHVHTFTVQPRVDHAKTFLLLEPARPPLRDQQSGSRQPPESEVPGAPSPSEQPHGCGVAQLEPLGHGSLALALLTDGSLVLFDFAAARNFSHFRLVGSEISEVRAHPLADVLIARLRSGSCQLFDVARLVEPSHAIPKRLEHALDTTGLPLSAVHPAGSGALVTDRIHSQEKELDRLRSSLVRAGTTALSKPQSVVPTGFDSAAARPLAAGGGAWLLPYPESSLKIASGLTKEEVLLNEDRLANILEEFGQFPDKYRSLVWRFLLRLPENREAFSVLAEQDIHKSFSRLEETVPMIDAAAMQRLKRICSAFAFYSPLFTECEFLPQLCLPFVRVFRADGLHAFECLLALVLNFFSDWFEFHPHPPFHYLRMCESILKALDPELFHHLSRISGDGHQFGQTLWWPLLSTTFSGALSSREWLRWMDHLMLHRDDRFFVAFVMAWTIYFKSSLLSAKSLSDLQFFASKRNPCSLEHILLSAAALYQKLKAMLAGSSALALGNSKLLGKKFEVISPGKQYPIFNQYPEYVVNFQLKERSKLAAAHKEMKEQQRLVREMKDLKQRLAAEASELMDHQRDRARVLGSLDRLAEDNQWKAVADRARVHRMSTTARLDALKAQNSLQLRDRQKMTDLQEKEKDHLVREYSRHQEMLRSQLEMEKENEALAGLELQSAEQAVETARLREMERHRRDLSELMERRKAVTDLDASCRTALWGVEDQGFAEEMERLQQEKRRMDELDELLREQNVTRHLLSLEEAKSASDVDVQAAKRQLRRRLAQTMVESDLSRTDKKRAHDELARKEELLKRRMIQEERQALQDRVRGMENEVEESRLEYSNLLESLSKEQDIVARTNRVDEFELELQQRRARLDRELAVEEEKHREMMHDLNARKRETQREISVLQAHGADDEEIVRRHREVVAHPPSETAGSMLQKAVQAVPPVTLREHRPSRKPGRDVAGQPRGRLESDAEVEEELKRQFKKELDRLELSSESREDDHGRPARSSAGPEEAKHGSANHDDRLANLESRIKELSAMLDRDLDFDLSDNESQSFQDDSAVPSYAKRLATRRLEEVMEAEEDDNDIDFEGLAHRLMRSDLLTGGAGDARPAQDSRLLASREAVLASERRRAAARAAALAVSSEIEVDDALHAQAGSLLARSESFARGADTVSLRRRGRRLSDGEDDSVSADSSREFESDVTVC